MTKNNFFNSGFKKDFDFLLGIDLEEVYEIVDEDEEYVDSLLLKFGMKALQLRCMYYTDEVEVLICDLESGYSDKDLCISSKLDFLKGKRIAEFSKVVNVRGYEDAIQIEMFNDQIPDSHVTFQCQASSYGLLISVVKLIK